MKVVIDACVLYPTVLREIVLGVAKAGAFTPLWSTRLLEEWRRAAGRTGPADNEIAESEIALAKAAFPDAMVEVSPETQSRLSLPDPDDTHVLAAAIDGGADELMTLNLRDFPTRILSQHGVVRRDPDGFLLELSQQSPDQVRAVVSEVLERAGAHGIDISNPRALLKKARLPRLAKALYQA